MRRLVRGHLPRGIGLEVAGTVDQIGNEVAGVQLGDSVFGPAAHTGPTAGASEHALLDIWFPRPAGLNTVLAKEKHIGGVVKVWFLARNTPSGLFCMSFQSAFKTVIFDRDTADGALLYALAEPTQIDIYDNNALERELRKFVPEAEVVNVVFEDWRTDEYAKGTWIECRPGHLTRLIPHLGKPEGRVFFAGADTSSRWLSWMVGAVDTGINAARELVATYSV